MKPDRTTQRLFVEGHTDGAVINKLVSTRLKVDLATPAHRIVDAPVGEGGFEQALKRFEDALAAQKPERVGLVVDRDGGDGKQDRWAAVHSCLADAKLDVPTTPIAQGVRVEAPWGRVGVWLMPNNVSTGDLEAFLEGLLPPSSTTLWQHAQKATDEALKAGATYRPVQRSKACLHAWLAWHDPPGNPFGTALEAGTLRADSADALAFLDWFTWLFGD